MTRRTLTRPGSALLAALLLFSWHAPAYAQFRPVAAARAAQTAPLRLKGLGVDASARAFAAPAAAASLAPAAAASLAPALAAAAEKAEFAPAAKASAGESVSLREAATPEQRALAVERGVSEGAASWGAERRLEDEAVVAGAPSRGESLARPSARAEAKAAPAVPSAPTPASRAALLAGTGLIAFSIAGFAVALPAALASASGLALWAGVAALVLARYLRSPSGPAPARGPPAAGAASGALGRAKALIKAAAASADSQRRLETRGGSWQAVRDWLAGAARTALLWSPLAIAGAALGQFFPTGKGEGMLAFEAVEAFDFGAHMLGYLATTGAFQAGSLAVFDVSRWAAARLGAGRSAPWLAGALSLAATAGLVLTVTASPSVLAAMLGIQAALLWLRVRSSSWAAPMMLSLGLSLFSLEAGSASVWLILGQLAPMAHLAPLAPAVAATAILLLGLAWAARSLRPAKLWEAAKAQVRRVREAGAAWNAPATGDAPRPLWPLLKLGALWALVVGALGDVVYGGMQALLGAGGEKTPELLVRLLSSPFDILVYNLVLVAVVEELVFRRGLFKGAASFLEKRGLSARKVFWLAAVASSFVFSIGHNIDFAAVLSKLGLESWASSAQGMLMSYEFTWGAFLGRFVVGMAFAWLYAASGTLVLPIAAHFALDLMASVGLRWGLIPFALLALGALLLQRDRKAAKKPSS